MTVGQRIAQKRKEAGLSQEALGELLGVSRQAIYKWESDSTLPEIEKLVALSRIFSVSVGWLLGVEEEAAPEGQTQNSGELTEKQLKMVEEIVARYLAAQPEPPQPPKRRRWPYVVAALALIVVFVNLFSRLDQLQSNYNNLQSSVGYITTNVNNQISSITRRMEEILKSQNDLTASCGSEPEAFDLARNEVTFTVRAIPKTYAEGMTAVFTADNGADPVEVSGKLGYGQEFSAEVTCGLTDDITISVVFVTGDKRETQVVDRYESLYSYTVPGGWGIRGADLWGSSNTWTEAEQITSFSPPDSPVWGDARVEEIRVGLFRDQKLVKWFEELPGQPATWYGDFPEGTRWFQGRGDETWEPGHVYCVAWQLTDQYGRSWMAWARPVTYDQERDFTEFAEVNYSNDPAEWELE